ncbi:VWA domain-containing protein [Anaerotignum lactatifermentans]|uniref:VWA domain-containing protein n=1 Tax=Anaerotignum lactatifermentans TaxID=160404 RepID=A0ABS2GBZ9_9FIRM|nr:VWA domain-containing protein [Anaerotignum lactatifermentans]MBM6828647.1 VWA domain-containing protein [Anaerotignum lactatifermentans]MBM6878565.1 VWA domain-containing protein [Anaerotignum lactatifermentans]MBM6950229.1 VWA domain-containing protein [Anaerotignum lactatifermentans]
MGILSFSKTAAPSSIECGGVARVKISLSTAPDILCNPADIVLLLDTSGSMSGAPLEHLKTAVGQFVDILYTSTNGENGQLGGGSRVSIVSFARTAREETPLTSSVVQLKNAVNALTSEGGTNHKAAFEKGQSQLDGSTASQRLILMFTDGRSTTGGSSIPVTDSIKADGITIYSMGFSGSSGLDMASLEAWASAPAAAFVSVAPDAAALEALFSDLAANITKPGATEIFITETLSGDFLISRVLTCDKGVVEAQGERTLRWYLSSLGATQPEGAALEFEIRHTGARTGSLAVNKSLLYEDAQRNQLRFPEPRLNVDCALSAGGENCPPAQMLVMDSCQQYLCFDLGEEALSSSGRLLELRLTLKQVCPGQRIALGLLLKEADLFGRTSPRGFKALTIPAHHASACRDLLVGPIFFVLPEDLAPQCGKECGQRRFLVQVFAHGIDVPSVC